MLLTKIIKIKINKGNLPFYKKKYPLIRIGNIIDIDIKDISKHSRKKVDVECDICGKRNTILYSTYNRNIKNYGFYSCQKCSNIKNRITNMNKYGTEHPLQNENIHKKVIDTCLKKYGVGNTFQSEEKKNKIKETMINRYGVDNPMKNENIKNKSKNTCLEKYGVEHIVNSKVYRESRKKRIIKKYKKYGIKYIKNDIYVCHCDNCNKMYKIKNRILLGRIRMKSVICTLCNPVGSSHGYENQLYEFIKENYNKDIIRNERKILNNKLELDIYIPELKLSFEFNGVYWHNELNKENNYHHEKTELCERKGIRLIHIYEDDWIYKHDIVKSMILNKLGKSNNKIYARKTELKEITDNKIVRYFLDKNHIQGFIGSKVKLGLFYNNELVSLMTFGKRRVAMGKKKSEEGEYELLRFCSKLNTNVVGGADKLFKYFVRNYSPKEITTYADRSWSQGNLYYNLGFSFKGKTKPNYYYVVGDVRHHRFNYRKDVLVKEGYDPNKTEHQIMIDRGIYRIYDSGNLRFVY